MSTLVRAVSWLVAVALMAAAMWLHGAKPRQDSKLLDPIASRGRVGTVVGNRVFSVQVDRVDVAAAIVKDDILKRTTVPSPGLFVIVYLRIRSNQKPFMPGHARLTTRGGLSYDESGRPDVSGRTSNYEPMFWAPASYVFEIPKDRLAGTRLILGESSLLNQLSAEVDVDLGIDARKAADLIGRAPHDYVLKTT
ncbi:hypothetical protein GCM10023196_107780 [Actinoallomurus vinaceus]|uniref:DUF4352 domain-containing protein n=1 Tax=Actinoallomurus vinaceus TaxID=1080074 RepID=A0ABP8UVD7_9ACTN